MKGRNIGFISTRFSGTDGVSLESVKWADVLEELDCKVFWFAGKVDRDPSISLTVPEAWFYHPENVWINERVFGTRTRSMETTQKINEIAERLKRSIYGFVEMFSIDCLIVENALCIPMHIPLGVAITQFIAETGIPTIAHHHDFAWERDRFYINAAADYLEMAFPPTLPSVHHVTINSFARHQLSWRKGQPSTLVPNVLDFSTPPPEPDAYVANFRKDIGLSEDDIILLQPTRVVPRKGIEHAIHLVARIDDPRCKLVVTHESGDEGDEYLQTLINLAEQDGVDLRFCHTHVGEFRRTNSDGHRTYTLADAYSQADFITYPSLYEGFGNALIEAFYFKKPVLVNRYSIYISDIEPKGFQVVDMDGYLTGRVVDDVRRVLDDAEYREQMVEENFRLCTEYFSYQVLQRELSTILGSLAATPRAPAATEPALPLDPAATRS